MRAAILKLLLTEIQSQQAPSRLRYRSHAVTSYRLATFAMLHSGESLIPQEDFPCAAMSIVVMRLP